MIDSTFLHDAFRQFIPDWKEYALRYPLKAMHESLDPAFRRTVLTESKVISAVLVILAADGIPMWTLFFGLYTQQPGRTLDKLAEYPAMQVPGWPGEIRDAICKAGADLIMEVGGQGPASVDKLKHGIRICRGVTGVEARHAIAESLNKHPILSRP